MAILFPDHFDTFSLSNEDNFLINVCTYCLPDEWHFCPYLLDNDIDSIIFAHPTYGVIFVVVIDISYFIDKSNERDLRSYTVEHLKYSTQLTEKLDTPSLLNNDGSTAFQVNFNILLVNSIYDADDINIIKSTLDNEVDSKFILIDKSFDFMEMEKTFEDDLISVIEDIDYSSLSQDNFQMLIELLSEIAMYACTDDDLSSNSSAAGISYELSEVSDSHSSDDNYQLIKPFIDHLEFLGYNTKQKNQTDSYLVINCSHPTELNIFLVVIPDQQLLMLSYLVNTDTESIIQNSNNILSLLNFFNRNFQCISCFMSDAYKIIVRATTFGYSYSKDGFGQMLKMFCSYALAIEEEIVKCVEEYEHQARIAYE